MSKYELPNSDFVSLHCDSERVTSSTAQRSLKILILNFLIAHVINYFKTVQE